MKIWTKVEQVVNDVDVEYPSLPRKRKAPKRYDSRSCGSDPPASVQDYYRPIFFEVIDLICCSIQTRFDQPGFQVYSQLECLLIKAANKEPYLEELQFVTNFYGGDVCKDQLKLHLEVFTNSIPSSESGKRQTFKSIVQFLSDLSHAQRLLMSQVCTVTPPLKDLLAHFVGSRTACQVQ